MEAAVVSGILKFVGNKLGPLLFSQYSSTLGARRDLQELQEIIMKVIFWLEAVGDEAPGSWFTKLKDFAYAADSFVDELQLKAQKHDASGIMSKYMCTIPKSLIFQTKVKAIKSKFSAIMRQRADFSLTTNSSQTGHPVRHINKIILERTTVSIVDEIIVGREQERDDIISTLVETNNQHNIKIASIFGLGGSGKTTVAKMVFNNNIIEHHFEVRLWIHVSLEFGIEKLLKKLFEAITGDGETSTDYSLHHMSITILSMLMGKKILIVLDDIWTEDRIKWEEFMVHLKNCAPGSRILLTTRNINVAKAVESTAIFHLPLLSLDNSWVLFRETLGTTKGSLSSALEEVGKEIVKKCGGVPLAIKALAGVLHGKEQIEEWHAIRDGDFLGAKDRGHSILESLILSYFNMPSHLKQCFAICSVFPKGHIIDEEKLIDLWIAHDMITLDSGVEYLEYIGQDFFHYLVQMSFLQVVSKGYGRVKYTMHGLIHDLALAIMDEEILHIMPNVATSSTKSYRYLSITEWPRNLLSEKLFEEARTMYVEEGDYFESVRALHNAKHLRSITVTHTKSVPTTILQVKTLKYLDISGLKCKVFPEGISNIWSLQVLRVTNCDILNLPKSIGNLQKLRTLNLSRCKWLKSLPCSINNCQMISHLDLSGCSRFEMLPDLFASNKRLRVLRIGNTKIKKLPSSVTSLGNLQCLDLQQCNELVELPEGLENMKRLIVLNLEGCRKLRAVPVGIGQLDQLENLNTFLVGGMVNSAKLSELGNFRRLRGGLTIKGIECVIDPGDAQNACLKEKTGLQRLQLQWGRNIKHKQNIEAVLNALEPPLGIKELYVDGYTGGQYAQWMLKQVGGSVQGLSHFGLLTVMTLRGLPKLKHLDGLIELPCLEELNLRWMPSLKSISGGPFPSLMKLRMEGLCGLGEIWMVTGRTLADDEKGQMEIGTLLSDLHIEECTRLVIKSHFPSSLKHLVLQRSNEQLLRGQEASSSSSFHPCYSFNHLKDLELWGMAASFSSGSPRSRSRHGWELLQHMTALESLKICQCGGLTELPDSMRSLTTLRSLFINFCSAICMLPEWIEELHSLQKMTIQSCHNLSVLPQSIGHLTSLQELRIECCHELHQLPERLGGLFCLRKFDIASLQGVTSLPKSMCQLTSLEELEISDCQGLRSLPGWIRGLPALQKLKITGCPELERRCEKEKGEDWHLINHIPRLQIGLDEEGYDC